MHDNLSQCWVWPFSLQEKGREKGTNVEQALYIYHLINYNNTWCRGCILILKIKKPNIKLKITKVSLSHMARGVCLQAWRDPALWVCHCLRFMTAKCAPHTRIFTAVFSRKRFFAISHWLFLQYAVDFRSLYDLDDEVFCAWNANTVHFPCGNSPHLSESAHMWPLTSLKHSLKHTSFCSFTVLFLRFQKVKRNTHAF